MIQITINSNSITVERDKHSEERVAIQLLRNVAGIIEHYGVEDGFLKFSKVLGDTTMIHFVKDKPESPGEGKVDTV